jgi:hypothetical protein
MLGCAFLKQSFPLSTPVNYLKYESESLKLKYLCPLLKAALYI